MRIVVSIANIVLVASCSPSLTNGCWQLTEIRANDEMWVPYNLNENGDTLYVSHPDYGSTVYKFKKNGEVEQHITVSNTIFDGTWELKDSLLYISWSNPSKEPVAFIRTEISNTLLTLTQISNGIKYVMYFDAVKCPKKYMGKAIGISIQ